MKKSIAFGVPIFLLLFLFLPDAAFGQYQQQQLPAAPAISISQTNAQLITINFSPREVQQAEADPQFVLKKLGPATSRACAYSRRISSYIWACAGGRKIRTYNDTLVRALERVVWPK